MHQFLKFIYFELTLYIFRTVFPSITRSSRLYTQQQAYVKQILLASGNEMEHLLATGNEMEHILPGSKQYLFDIYLLLYVQS
jgi:hypothetical protein